MKKLYIIASFLVLSISAIACPTGAIDVVDNGNGNYTFTLNLDYTSSSLTDITFLSWDFGDGTTSNTGPTGLTVTHQYLPASSQTYQVVASWRGQQAGCVDSAQEELAVPDINPSIDCPVATFVMKPGDWCNTGELELNWAFCDVGSSGYWTPNTVDWTVSNGVVFTTLGLDPAVFNFGSAANQTITGLATFTGQNGEVCSTVILYSEIANNDPCGLLNSDSTATPYLEVEPFYAQPSLYVDGTSYCQTDPISFFDAGGAFPTVEPGWSYEVFVNGTSAGSGSGLPNDGTSFFQATLPSGDHQVELVYTFVNASGDTCTVGDGLLVTVDSCEVEPCELCTNFRPEPGERYWLSAWVKEKQLAQVKTYQNTQVDLEFVGNGQTVSMQTTGEIIEGWQRIVGSFTVPLGTTDLNIHLVNNGTLDAFFDDVRIHPFHASMKSYVYDPETLVLSAELDDNNYATFYEYDKELQLIRIKKETSRGIMTIQESRSSNPKSN